VVVNRRSPLVIDKNRAYHVQRALDPLLMQKAAHLLLGQHDFSTFRAQNCQSNSPIKTLDVADVVREGETFRFTFSARSFLYHQVRNMVGTLLLVGTGQWSLDDFKAAFAAHDRTKGGPTAPPQALYFLKVDY
jgi:tRNA pseudouridine38-40 synthase